MNATQISKIDFSIKCAIIIFRPIAWLLKPFCKYIMVASPAEKGSLGDQAMVQPLQDLALQKQMNVKQFYPKGQMPQKVQNSCAPPFEFAMVSRKDELLFILNLLFCESIVFIGADVFDGRYNVNVCLKYLKFANIASDMGKKARYLGFSFSSKPAPEVVKCVKDSSAEIEFFVRDCDSYERFVSFTNVRNRQLVADNAFNLRPNLEALTGKECSVWIKSQPEGSVFIGVNANTHTAQRVEQMYDAYAREINILSKVPENHFVLVPHDMREGQSDYSSLLNILQRLPEEVQQRCFLLGKDIDAWDVKALAQSLDIIITGRMHFAIAALGVGTPAVCITYADKFNGLFKHFSLQPEEFAIEPEIAYGEIGIMSRNVESKLATITELKESVRNELVKVKQLAKINLNGI